MLPLGAPLSNKPRLPQSVQKLLEFLKQEQQVHNLNLIAMKLLQKDILQQVKLWIRQLEKPIGGLGNRPLALRGAATSVACATDFVYDLTELGLATQKKRNIVHAMII